MSASSETVDESHLPVRIGAGSFATVWVISGGPVAYKEVATLTEADATTLCNEYNIHHKIWRLCEISFIFSVPRVLAFNDPTATMDGFTSTEPPLPLHYKPRIKRYFPIITPGVMQHFSRPTYAMDRVHALPFDARRYLADLYFPSYDVGGPSLCRLYFGKDYTGAPRSRFINTNNFPLDATRYKALREAFTFTYLASAAEVACGMGEMLSRLHYKICVDARDVEFVLGGDGGSGFTYFLIDFNQVRPWTKSIESVIDLVSAFFANDPYYPRPRPLDPLYNHFKTSYLTECNDVDVAIAAAFLFAIETIQAQRDASRN